MSIKSIKTDIDNIIEDAHRAISAIEALHSDDETLVKAFYFRTLDLSAALAENAHLQAEKRRMEQLSAKAKQEPPAQQALFDVQIQTVRFAAEGTIEQLKALARFLRENKIKYYAI